MWKENTECALCNTPVGALEMQEEHAWTATWGQNIAQNIKSLTLSFLPFILVQA